MIVAISWVIVLSTLLSWTSAAILLRAALHPPRIRFLSAVTSAAVVGAMAGTLLAPLAIARILGASFDPPLSTLLLVVAVLLFQLPGPAFLALYHFGWFSGGQS